MSALEDGVRALLELPRGRQIAAARSLMAELGEPEMREEWNTAFGPDSLFEAWTRTTVASGVYAANASVLRPMMDRVPNWTIVEVGAGNGELWRRLFHENDRGRLIAIDPSEAALAEMRRHMPFGVELETRVGRVEQVLPLDEADAVVCSLTLHHLAGRDAGERRRHGLDGIGKLEVLQAFRAAVERKGGFVLVSEADIHCEIDLASGSDILRERLLDSYVRRCGRSILDDLRGSEGDLADRWRHILHHWCLNQVAMADLPVAERDVYELDVGRWLSLFDRAGLRVERHRFSDAYGLFHQYVASVD